MSLPLRYRSDFSGTRRLALRSTALADDLDVGWIDLHEKGGHRKPVLIDFEKCHYIDVATLANLVALFVQRNREGLETYIGVPEAKPVRDFLRAWRFPENFSAATGVPFEDVLLSSDQKYRGESQSTYHGVGGDVDTLEWDRDWHAGYPTRRNFFEFATYHKDSAIRAAPRSTAIPRLEGHRWNGPLIRQVLSRHLVLAEDPETGDPSRAASSDDIARVAVYESLSNAVRHPDATVIQAVSKFDHQRDRGSRAKEQSGHLRICVWDDGKSIVDTLAPLIRDGASIRAMRFPRFMYDRIAVTVSDFNGAEESPFVVDQGVDPEREADDVRILLASLYPGTSRSVGERVANVDPFDLRNDEKRDILIQSQGLGLYALLRTVVDVYQGWMFLRTGNLKLQLKHSSVALRKETGARYHATLTRYPTVVPPFNGNLLVLHFPVRRYRAGR